MTQPNSTERRCPKCGSNYLALKYLFSVDMISVKCATCDYRWEEVPRDRALPSTIPEEL